MLRWTLLGLVSVLGAFSLLTLWRAPTLFLWRLSILAGEFGQWGALGAVAVLAVVGLRWEAGDVVTVATVTLAALSSVLLLRPAWLAWRQGRRLPSDLVHRFGPHAGPAIGNLFSWRRLWALDRPACDAYRAEMSTHLCGHTALGAPLALDFYRARAHLPAPCVVVIHGGGWDGGDRTQLPALNHRLAAQGYAVAAISYGLAPAHRWPSQRDDVHTALLWLKANATPLGLDPTRFVLLGRSAGGQLATATASHLRDPAIRGAVAYYAPHDLAFAWQFSREDDLLNAVSLLRNYTGGTPETAADNYRTASAYHTADRSIPPTLLVHGAQDSLVWHRQSERLTARLGELGVPCGFISLPWATHACDFSLRGPSGQLATAALERFLAAVTTPER